jgi:hypothetical protein
VSHRLHETQDSGDFDLTFVQREKIGLPGVRKQEPRGCQMMEIRASQIIAVKDNLDLSCQPPIRVNPTDAVQHSARLLPESLPLSDCQKLGFKQGGAENRAHSVNYFYQLFVTGLCKGNGDQVRGIDIRDSQGVSLYLPKSDPARRLAFRAAQWTTMGCRDFA